MKKVFVFVLLIVFAASGFAQISAKLMREMDLSDTNETS